MRLVTLLCLICLIFSCFTSPFPSPCPTMHEHIKLFRYYTYSNTQPFLPKTFLIIEDAYFIKLIIVGLIVLSFIFKLVLSPIVFARYIRFDLDLTCLRNGSVVNPPFMEVMPIVNFIVLVIHVNDIETALFLIFEAHFLFSLTYFKTFRWTRLFRFSRLLTFFYLTYVASLAPSVVPLSSILKFLFKTYESLYPVPIVWVAFLKILLSNDVEMNPGDFSNSFLSFCNWNVNSLVKDNFQRVQLLEAHNSLHFYDFISLTEVSINDAVEIPIRLMDNYTFVYKGNCCI